MINETAKWFMSKVNAAGNSEDDAIWKPITRYWTDVIYKQPLFFFSF